MRYGNILFIKTNSDTNNKITTLLSTSLYSQSCQLLLIFLSLFSITGCYNRIEDITVKGHLYQFPKTNIYLNEFSGDSIYLVDSVKTNKKGQFQFNLKVYTPTFYYINSNNCEGEILLLISPGDLPVVNVQESNLSIYSVDGSRGSINTNYLLSKLNRTRRNLDSLSLVYQRERYSAKFDSIKRVLDQKYLKFVDDHRNYSINFINSNSYSLASILALYQEYTAGLPVFNVSSDYHLFSIVDSSLSSVYPNNALVQSYHDRMKKIKEQYMLQKGQDQMFKPGNLLPDITYSLQTGTNFKISDIWYRLLLINFSSPGCNSCINYDRVHALYKEYLAKGFFVLQVYIDDYLHKLLIPADSIGFYNVVVTDTMNRNILDTLRIGTLPSNYLTDRWGNIKAINLNETELRKKLTEMLP